jgi:rare lipoprotein A
MAKRLTLLIGLLTVLSSCVHIPYQPRGGVETGVASWYGADFHGKLTSNKEIYDMYDMTAAHRTLPFGTYVMVTNLDNGLTATVRINDRGPFVGDRIIDLSYAAAKVLGMIGPGTVPVKLEVLKEISPAPGSQGWSVQAGSFISKDNASNLIRKLKGHYKGVYIALFKTSTQVYYRVRIKASDGDAARNLAQRLFADGYTVIVLEER